MTNKQDKNPNTIHFLHIASIIGLIIYILAYFLIQSKILKIPMLELFNSHTNLLYVPNDNLCIMNRIGNMPIYSFSYFFIALATVLAIAKLLLGLLFGKKKQLLFLRKFLFIFITISLFLLIILQQIGRIRLVTNKAAYTIDKTEQDKLLHMFELLYDFSIKAKFVLNQKQKVAFYTDMNCSIDPCMYSKRLLKYFLYPNILLTDSNNSITNYTLLFHVNNPRRYIIRTNDKILFNLENKIILTKKNQLK